MPLEFSQQVVSGKVHADVTVTDLYEIGSVEEGLSLEGEIT